MRQCTGCGRYDSEPLGFNKNGNPYLACCPDNNYVEVNDIKIYSELQIVQSLKHHNILDSEIHKIISFMEPMEIPSDEEIKSYSDRYSTMHEDVSDKLGKYLVSAIHIDGAKWMKEQIIGLETNNIEELK
jgi:hypothetical protein